MYEILIKVVHYFLFDLINHLLFIDCWFLDGFLPHVLTKFLPEHLVLLWPNLFGIEVQVPSFIVAN